MPEKLNKNCVISAVGKNSLHKQWIDGECDFDLHLIVYDDSYSDFCNDTKFISCRKGYKFRSVYHYLTENPVYLEKYEYFFLPDDDISISPENISELFGLTREHNLQITQPALRDSYYTYEHTLYDKSCMLRYTNFVEMMVPCFSREALKKVLFTFNENNSGWGSDFHWPFLIQYTGVEIAIIDAVQAIHVRPVQSGNQQNITDFQEYLTKYGLSTEIHEHGFIPAKTNSPFIDREHFLSVKRLVRLITDKILHELRQGKPYPWGLSGLTGVSLFFIHYYRFTEKRIFLDHALNLTDRISENIGLIKNDFTLATGLPGFSWFIEYLARHGYIENNTDEVLSEIYAHYNKSGHLSLKVDLKNRDYLELVGKESLIRSDTDLAAIKQRVLASSCLGLTGLSGIGLSLIAIVKNDNKEKVKQHD